MSPGREVRLRYAYFITCEEVIKNQEGEIIELRCIYDPESKRRNKPSDRKGKAILHWVSAQDALEATVNLYDHLFSHPFPEEEGDGFLGSINRNSLETLNNCKFEPSIKEFTHEQTIQFERLGYFCRDKRSSGEKLVFNRTLSLRDSWSKLLAKKSESDM